MASQLRLTSQVSAYTFSETVGTYTSIVGGTQLVTTTAGVTSYDTDGSSVTLAVSSRFTYNGITVTSVNMTADGALWLNPNTTTTGNSVTGPIASTAVATGVISAMGMDLRSTSLATQVYERRWQDDGTEDIFQWKNAARYLQDAVERFSFQIRINKTTGVIRVVYGNMTTIANSTTYQPYVGLRGSTNTDFNNRRLTGSVPDATPNWGAPNGTTAGTSNAHSVRFTNAATCYPSSGLTFIWTPIVIVPLPDNCASAIAITLPYTSPITSTTSATSDVPTSVSACVTQGKNIWYSVVGNNTTYTATTCNASTNFDTEVRVLTGTCSALNSMTEVTCNDDDLSCSSSTRSTASWCAGFGVTYYISVGGYSSTSGDVKLTVSSAGVACSALPIELLEFDVYMVNTAVNVKWSTATESNCDYFMVERSIDGIDWEGIAQVNGSGNSSTIHFYNTVDLNAPYGYNYYRLKQVDYNGQYEIFPIKSVYKPFKKRNVTMMVNILGQQINNLNEFKGVFFMIYDDGSIDKRVKN